MPSPRGKLVVRVIAGTVDLCWGSMVGSVLRWPVEPLLVEIPRHKLTGMTLEGPPPTPRFSILWTMILSWLADGFFCSRCEHVRDVLAGSGGHHRGHPEERNRRCTGDMNTTIGRWDLRLASKRDPSLVSVRSLVSGHVFLWIGLSEGRDGSTAVHQVINRPGEVGPSCPSDKS